MPQNPVLMFLRAHRRLLIALACYLILILIALYAFLPIQSSNDRFLLGIVLLVFAVLIMKTVAHAMSDKSE